MDVSWDWLNITTTNIKKIQQIIQISTPSHNGLFDITREVERIVTENGVRSGMVNVYSLRELRLPL